MGFQSRKSTRSPYGPRTIGDRPNPLLRITTPSNRAGIRLHLRVRTVEESQNGCPSRSQKAHTISETAAVHVFQERSLFAISGLVLLQAFLDWSIFRALVEKLNNFV